MIFLREAHWHAGLLASACSLVVPGKTPMELMPHWEKMAMTARLNPAP